MGEYRSWSSSLCSLLNSLVTSSILGWNISLSTIFSNTLSLSFYLPKYHIKTFSLYFSLNLSDRVSYPYKTSGKIVCVYYNLYIYIYRLQSERQNILHWMKASITWIQSATVNWNSEWTKILESTLFVYVRLTVISTCGFIICFKTEFNVKYIRRFSSYRAVNTLNPDY